MKKALFSILLYFSTVLTSEAAVAVYSCPNIGGSSSYSAYIDLRKNMAGILEGQKLTLLDYKGMEEVLDPLPPQTILIYEGESSSGNLLRLKFNVSKDMAELFSINSGSLVSKGAGSCVVDE